LLMAPSTNGPEPVEGHPEQATRETRSASRDQ